MQGWWVRHDSSNRKDSAEDAREHALALLIEPGNQP